MANKLPKASELRTLDEAHLDEKLKETVQAQFDLRFRTTSGDRTNTAAEAKQLRRQVARIKTIQHERKLQASEAGAKNA
ncbi:MAG TPA: 50S ribosomal protein L29 [Gemmatales bacterium]|nr:50S ribosomal protein L29 [Gemmatales bacterium]